ncbi:MAG: hypothetical protein H6739_29385 [Alphaproteobacteria bacterium]|nr:hypothetical protein [Alphaproteobacteria bacterium]
MANEIVPSGIGDLIAGEVMANEYMMLLAERDNSVLNHPALFHATATSPTSNVVRVPHVGLGGYDLLSATTPGSEIANTALIDGSSDITISSRAKVYMADDLAQYITDGKLDAIALAQDAVVSISQTLISLIASVAGGFTATEGTSGVDATWNDVLAAKTTLDIANAAGPMLAIVHSRQWGDLESDALSMGVLPAQSMSGVIMQGLSGYRGRYLGIDFFVSNHVPTANAGADRAGGIFTRGGIAWADAQMPAENDPNIVNLGRGRFERVRQGRYLATSYVTSYHCGVAQAIDAAGVSLVSDA